MATSVEVHAPSRLHFGLLLPQGGARRFGGVGAMVDRPGAHLHLVRSGNWQTEGPLASRIEAFADRWAAHFGWTARPPCRIEVLGELRQHIGLGVGTQLGLSVAAGLCALLDVPAPSLEELATSVNRGRRSAIGTHGFALGGLLADQGKTKHERLAPLAWRVALPSTWRFVLLCPRAGEGVSGEREERAFADLPAASADAIARLQRCASAMRLAAQSHDFDQFSQALFDFGRSSGECFASAQGGVYAGDRLARWIDRLRSWGVQGVGQSSWGPTLFALTASLEDAETLASRVVECDYQEEWNPILAAPQNRGAVVTTIS